MTKATYGIPAVKYPSAVESADFHTQPIVLVGVIVVLVGILNPLAVGFGTLLVVVLAGLGVALIRRRTHNNLVRIPNYRPIIVPFDEELRRLARALSKADSSTRCPAPELDESTVKAAIELMTVLRGMDVERVIVLRIANSHYRTGGKRPLEAVSIDQDTGRE